MRSPARATATCVLAAILLALQGPPASADEGCGVPGRPACTLFRPVPGDVTDVPFGAGDCVVLVGGLGSTPESTEIAFEPLLARPEGLAVSTLRYDSLGRIAPAALALRDHIRRIATSCGMIHVLAHSMGGVVADRAFSMGLSERDRVATYLPLASPHNGSTFARALCGIGDVDAGYTRLLRLTAELLGQADPSSAAICDLARVEASRPARGVATARLRLVTDPLVPRRDHATRYRDVRELLPQADGIEGHGGILRHGQVRAVVERTIEDRAVPADERDQFQRSASRVLADAADGPTAGVHEAIGGLLWAGAVIAGLASRAADLVLRR